MNQIFSKYSLEARIYPTIIGMIPFYLLQYIYFSNFIFSELFSAKIITNISSSLVALYFVSEFFVRFPSKLFEDKLFNKKIGFPTTEFLLFSNHEYTKSFKEKIRTKIKKDFSIILFEEKEELENEEEARMRIKEAIGLIIGLVRGGYMVLKHNISYGFFRNLWGASLIGAISSVVLFFLSLKNSYWVPVVAFLLFIFYILYLTFGKYIIKYFGANYARKLIEEYLKS